MDILGSVIGIAQLGSSVWGNFQNLEIEKSLDDIEEHTRWLKRGLVELPDSLLNQVKSLVAVFGNSGVVTYYLQEMDGSLNAIENTLSLLWTYSRSYWLDAVTEIRDVAAAVRGSGTINLSITIDGVTRTQTVSLNRQAAYNFS